MVRGRERARERVSEGNGERGYILWRMSEMERWRDRGREGRREGGREGGRKEGGGRGGDPAHALHMFLAFWLRRGRSWRGHVV